jgi:hypothetical protein
MAAKSSVARFLPRQNSVPCTMQGQMHQCTRGNYTEEWRYCRRITVAHLSSNDFHLHLYYLRIPTYWTSSVYYRAREDTTINQLERIWKDQVWSQALYENFTGEFWNISVRIMCVPSEIQKEHPGYDNQKLKKKCLETRKVITNHGAYF